MQKYIKKKVSQVEKKDSTSKSGDIVVDESLTDLPSPPTKKQKTIITKTSEFTLEHALFNSITLAKSLSASVTYHANNPENISKMNSLSCGRVVRAFASHVFF